MNDRQATPETAPLDASAKAAGSSSAGRVVALLSSGIDSPVAAYLILNRGFDLVALHMDNRPYTDDRQLDKFQALVRQLEAVTDRRIVAYTAAHGDPTQTAIAEACDTHVQCVLCKRFMLRAAEALAHRVGAGAIVTGDSLGQVASQTLKNLAGVSRVVTLPILRPLIGFDKEETVALARQIGTFDLSTEPDGGCTIVPRKPSTGASVPRLEREEAKLDLDALAEAVEHSFTKIHPLDPLNE